MELKDRRFWATHVNRKWTFCIVGQGISKREKALLPVDARRSKMPLLKLPTAWQNFLNVIPINSTFYLVKEFHLMVI